MVYLEFCVEKGIENVFMLDGRFNLMHIGVKGRPAIGVWMLAPQCLDR